MCESERWKSPERSEGLWAGYSSVSTQIRAVWAQNYTKPSGGRPQTVPAPHWFASVAGSCVSHLRGLGGIRYEPPPRIRSPQLCNLVTLVRYIAWNKIWCILVPSMARFYPAFLDSRYYCKATGFSGFHYLTMRKCWTSFGLLAFTSMLAASQCQKRCIGCSGDAVSLFSHASSCVLNIMDTCDA